MMDRITVSIKDYRLYGEVIHYTTTQQLNHTPPDIMEGNEQAAVKSCSDISSGQDT